jgi:hypothetical protein
MSLPITLTNIATTETAMGLRGHDAGDDRLRRPPRDLRHVVDGALLRRMVCRVAADRANVLLRVSRIL